MAVRKFFSLSSTVVTLLLAFYFTFFLNAVLVKKLYAILSSAENPGLLFAASIPVFFISAFTILFTPFVTRYTTKPFFITILLISSIINYIAFQFGIVFNKDMMVNIFETTAAEAASYLNIKLVLCFVASGLLPALLLLLTDIRYEKWTKEILKKIGIVFIAAGMIGMIGAAYYKDYASISRNHPKIQKDIVPTYYISSTIKYIKGRFFTKPLPYQEIGADAKRIPVVENENYLVVFLVGETARAENYELNGYKRETNFYTRNIPNLTYFKNVTSCGTATAVSLPCMFSLLGKTNYSLEKSESQDNVIDILVRAGAKAVWIDNNTGCKGVCRGITSYSTTMMPELNCSGEECTDEVLLQVMDSKINSFKGKEGIIFLHLLGSHGPTYYKRYPESHARFKPDCETSDLQKCTDEQITNSYDNTILFTDYLMAKVINNLRQFDDTYHTAVFYISDHGESLGENGVYLHGMPYSVAPDEQTHVPLMIWLSDKMNAHKTVDMECLKREAETQKFSHDNLSHTLLNIMDVSTSLYDRKKDVLWACQREHK
jgi:lipid A ethanolaminephosphotransferase